MLIPLLRLERADVQSYRRNESASWNVVHLFVSFSLSLFFSDIFWLNAWNVKIFTYLSGNKTFDSNSTQMENVTQKRKQNIYNFRFSSSSSILQCVCVFVCTLERSCFATLLDVCLSFDVAVFLSFFHFFILHLPKHRRL